MKLYRISQTQNLGYDTYDSAVVCAPNEETARNIHPGEAKMLFGRTGFDRTWCSMPEDVLVEYIGKATKGINQGVIVASFNAG